VIPEPRSKELLRSSFTRCGALAGGIAVLMAAVMSGISYAEPGDSNHDKGCKGWALGVVQNRDGARKFIAYTDDEGALSLVQVNFTGTVQGTPGLPQEIETPSEVCAVSLGFAPGAPGEGFLDIAITTKTAVWEARCRLTPPNDDFDKAGCTKFVSLASVGNNEHEH
jgi:hypothetical protein